MNIPPDVLTAIRERAHTDGPRLTLTGPRFEPTACGYYLPEESTDHWVDNATAVTCRGCQRVTGGAR